MSTKLRQNSRPVRPALADRGTDVVLSSRKLLRIAAAVVALHALHATPARAQEAESEGDVVAEHQSASAYMSISDGQPGDIGAPEVNVSAGWSKPEKGVFQITLGYTFPGPRLVSNALLEVTAPTLNVGEGNVDFERSVSLSWQQRWSYGSGTHPTFSTQATLQIPYNEPGATVDAVLTGILARNLGRGVGYLNAWMETQGGSPSGTEYGALVGFKQPAAAHVFLYGDASYQTDDRWTWEVALEVDTASGVSIGPGASVSLGPGGGPATYGGGVLVTYSF